MIMKNIRIAALAIINCIGLLMTFTALGYFPGLAVAAFCDMVIVCDVLNKVNDKPNDNETDNIELISEKDPENAF